MKPLIYSRWHRYDENGVKHITRSSPDSHPEPLSEPGYTVWTRGTGKHTPEAYKNVSKAVSIATKGKPKSPETKEKMRQAKLGKPKTQEQKLRMSISHKLRLERKKQHENNNGL